jgi:hypothetical protein
MSETEKRYKTTFVNKRSSRVVLMEFGRKMLAVVQAGETTSVESFSPYTCYARFKEITYLPNNKIEVAENKNWENPFKSEHFIELRNDEGAEVEMIRVDGVYQEAFRGLPRILPVPLGDGLIFYKTIRWKKITEKTPKRNFPQYLETVEKIVLEKIPRPKQEIENIKAELESIARRQVADTLKRRIQKSGLEEQKIPQSLTEKKE